ncbi:hypothetical protein IID24_01005 [Patescibacteria group bacterium]|nr:hypothetical protein [Patescibacteria group bacterium]
MYAALIGAVALVTIVAFLIITTRSARFSIILGALVGTMYASLIGVFLSGIGSLIIAGIAGGIGAGVPVAVLMGGIRSQNPRTIPVFALASIPQNAVIGLIVGIAGAVLSLSVIASISIINEPALFIIVGVVTGGIVGYITVREIAKLPLSLLRRL